MTTFERQQRLLDIIRKQPGIRVPEIARTLDVSEGTIRNDLRALSKTGQLTRVRGGAIVDGQPPVQPGLHGPGARVSKKPSAASPAGRPNSSKTVTPCSSTPAPPFTTSPNFSRIAATSPS